MVLYCTLLVGISVNLVEVTTEGVVWIQLQLTTGCEELTASCEQCFPTASASTVVVMVHLPRTMAEELLHICLSDAS